MILFGQKSVSRNICKNTENRDNGLADIFEEKMDYNR